MQLRTGPGNPDRGFGTQIAQGGIEDLVGSDQLEWIQIGDRETAIVDHVRQAETAEAWSFRDSDENIAGKPVVVSHDSEADAYADTSLSVDEARQVIAFTDEAEGDGDGTEGDVRETIESLVEGPDDKQREIAPRRSARPSGSPRCD